MPRKKPKAVLFKNVKAALIRRLTANGYANYDGKGKSWHKACPRHEKTITLDDTTFEYFECEHPAKEGWCCQRFRYTYKNVEKLNLSIYR